MSDLNDVPPIHEPASAKPPIDEPKHLEYRTPEPRDEEPASVVGGFVLAVLFWAAVGFYNMDKLTNLAGLKRRADMHLVASFFAVAASATVALIVLRKDCRYLLLGLLIGTAIAGLIDGICFMTP